MLKTQTIIFSLFFLLAFSSDALAQDADFRNVNWSMTVEEVKNAETAKLRQENAKALVYSTTLNNDNFYLVYHFGEEGLYHAFYQYNEKHTNKNSFLNAYDDLKTILQNKYGTPEVDKVDWLNDLHINNPENYGLAISTGHLEKRAQWSTDTTQVDLILSGDNFKINLHVAYTSLALVAAEAAKKQEDLEDVF